MLKTENYSKAYVEVLEILKKIEKKDLEKIPYSLLNALEKNKDKNYIFEIDDKNAFEKQEIMRETTAILAYIYVNYWSSITQKETIMKKFSDDIKKSEQLKTEKYDTDVFKQIQPNKENTNFYNNEEKMQLIKYKKENFIIRLLNKIKNMFYMKRG